MAETNGKATGERAGADVMEIGERLHNIEERLASLEANINNLYSERGISPSASVTQLRPARTRRPRKQNNGSD